jgi:hypothetical protein
MMAKITEDYLNNRPYHEPKRMQAQPRYTYHQEITRVSLFSIMFSYNFYRTLKSNKDFLKKDRRKNTS